MSGQSDTPAGPDFGDGVPVAAVPFEGALAGHPGDLRQMLDINFLGDIAMHRQDAIAKHRDFSACLLKPSVVHVGATYIERHFTLDRTWKGTDHAASLEPDGLRRLQRNLVQAAEALEARQQEILPIEEPQRAKLKWTAPTGA